MLTIGGLEPNENDRDEIVEINNTKYIFSEKFKTMLRDNIINWDTFLSVYNSNINNEIMFKQVQSLLDIKEENLKDKEVFISALKKIYNMPLNAHVSHLINQFMIQEPMTYAIHGIFNTIKKYFESIMELFIEERNNYIIEKNTKDKTNDYPSLLASWKKINTDYNLESSSIKLLMLHPPKSIPNKLHFKISGVDLKPLINKLKLFKYPGFCPRVPHKRLTDLLKFPVNEMTAIINKLNPKIKFPNFTELEKKALSSCEKNIKKPIISDDYKRETPPKELTEKEPIPTISDSSSQLEKEKASDKNANKKTLLLIKWYVDHILLMRKSLATVGSQYETYFIKIAKQLNTVNKILEEELVFEK